MNVEDFLREFCSLRTQLAQAGDGWLDAELPSEEDLDRLETALGGRLPASYRAFLLAFGGASLPNWHVRMCGVRPGDPLSTDDDQVFGQTLANRARYGLPLPLVVIEQQSRNDRCVCVAASGPSEGPVLSYRLDKRTSEVRNPTSFAEYLLKRCSAFVQLAERSQPQERRRGG